MPPSRPLTRTACPTILVFFSSRTGLSMNRKFMTGRVIFPFSIRNTPSRVNPVCCNVC